MGWGSLQVWNDDEIAPYAGFPSTRRPTWNDGTVSGYPKWIEFDPANTGKIGMVINLASGTVFGDFFEAGGPTHRRQSLRGRRSS
jgi:hypothetical protein